MNEIRHKLIVKQNNKCYYCNCEMCETQNSPQQATIEHLVDKWSSPKHIKNNDESNLVAACFSCNNSRGAIRNKIARDYYKKQAINRNMKVTIAAISSKKLYSLFGPVPQNLFV